MTQRRHLLSQWRQGRWTLGLALAVLMVLGAWLAWLTGGVYLRHLEQEAASKAMLPLSRSIEQTLGNLEARLMVDNTRELVDRNQLDVALQGLRLEFPYVMALEVRNSEGMLLQTTLPVAHPSLNFLAPGHAALYETASRTGRPIYSAVYKDPLRGQDSHWVDLFAPSPKIERQGLVAKLAVNEIFWNAREDLAPELMAGVNLVIKETLRVTPLKSQDAQSIAAEWPLERHGLKMTFMAEASATQAASVWGMQWLLALLGSISVLFVSLWVRSLRLRQHTKLRLAQMEERMHSDARVATLGEMSTAIAHELNQPLGAISNYAYAAEKIARQQTGTDPALLEGLAQIRHEAQRGAEVIKSIRSFIKREETASELIDVASMMHDLQPLLELQAQSQGSRLSVEVEQGLRIHCSKALLQQVLLNLARNGLEAMSNVPKPSRHLRINAALNPKTGRASFVVTDSGHGISDDTRKSLFKPFFTTKKDGLGIGLSLCLSIAERQGGTVSWSNNQEGGASFEIELPVEHYAKVTA